MSIVLGKRLESFQQVTLEAVVITEAVVVLGAEVVEVPELEAVVFPVIGIIFQYTSMKFLTCINTEIRCLTYLFY
jgi:hypothetical protein